MSDAEKFVYGLVVTQAPRLQEVLNANGWETITLPVATFSASVNDDSSVDSTCKMSEITLHNIRRILLDEKDQQFSFEGDHQFSYMYDSKNESSRLPQITRYRVIVRWTGMFEEYSTAYLLQIN